MSKRRRRSQGARRKKRRKRVKERLVQQGEIREPAGKIIVGVDPAIGNASVVVTRVDDKGRVMIEE